MTPQELKWIAESLAKYGFGAIVAGFIIYVLIRHWLGGYLPEKGKNLAAMEDLEELTNIVKDVEHKYNVLIKQMEAKQQLRMAAMDKRLQAHQDALTLWRRMLRLEDKSKQAELVIESQKWWDENCLYLEPEVRDAFSVAYHSYNSRNTMLRGDYPAEHISLAWERFMAFPDILFNAVKLPSLTHADQEEVSKTIQP